MHDRGQAGIERGETTLVTAGGWLGAGVGGLGVPPQGIAWCAGERGGARVWEKRVAILSGACDMSVQTKRSRGFLLLCNVRL